MFPHPLLHLLCKVAAAVEGAGLQVKGYIGLGGEL